MMDNLLKLAENLGLYVHKEVTPSFELFHDEASQFSLYWSEGISHAVRSWGDQLNKSRQRLYVTTLPWYCNGFGGFAKQAQLVTSLSDDLLVWDPRDNFLILCNAEDEVYLAKNSGFKNAILCNHNCLLDSNLYTIDTTVSESGRPYNLVINCRPEKWKRPFYASGVENLAVIKGKNFRPHDYFELESLSPAYINSQILHLGDVVKVLNKSKVGGIFSSEEGGCYSSSEYLLCGLPVVSTPSNGGRDVWYNSDNAIIVNSAEEVGDAVKALVQRFAVDPGLRTRIRNSHIEKSFAMRKLLFNEVDRLAAHAGLHFKFEEIFNKQYRNKMTRYIKIGN